MENNAFVYNGTRNEYYFGAFGGNMPDLNYSNQAVREEIKKIIKHWMDFGFDGMRVDAVRYLYDNVKSGNYMDDSKSHEIFAEWREILDSYESPKFMMCEAWIEDENRTTLEEYLGTNSKPEFNLVLDFNQGRPCYTSVQNNTSTFNFGTTFKANTPSTPYTVSLSGLSDSDCATLASLIGGATNKGVYINLDLSGSGITYIPDGAFNADTNSALATYLRGVVVPNGVTCIGHNAFRGCTNLSGNVTIPTACTDLGQAIFAGTNVTSLKDLCPISSTASTLSTCEPSSIGDTPSYSTPSI